LNEIECVEQECPPFDAVVTGDLREEPWYEWFMQPGGFPRTKCKEHGVMSWAMKIDRRYPDTPSKHTMRGVRHPVYFRGRMVQVWECKPCGKWVVK